MIPDVSLELRNVYWPSQFCLQSDVMTTNPAKSNYGHFGRCMEEFANVNLIGLKYVCYKCWALINFWFISCTKLYNALDVSAGYLDEATGNYSGLVGVLQRNVTNT